MTGFNRQKMSIVRRGGLIETTMKSTGKIVVLIGDGMADHPVAELNGKTPLEAADCPNMDALGRAGRGGLIETVAEGLKPSSDVAIMSVLGYDQRNTTRAAGRWKPRRWASR